MHLFIFGQQRTGTTLLFELLKRHPDIYGTPNDFNILRLKSHGYECGTSHQKEKFLTWGICKSTNNTLLPKLTRSEILKLVLDLYFKDRKELIYIHKTPKAEFQIDEYRKAFDDCKFIFCIRNPYAVISSRYHLNKDWEGALKKLDSYLDSLKIIDENCFKSDVLTIISYEELVEKPKEVLNYLFRLLNIKSIDVVKDFCQEINSSYGRFESGITQESIDKWKTKLFPNQIKDITKKLNFFDYKFKSYNIHLIFNNYLE